MHANKVLCAVPVALVSAFAACSKPAANPVETLDVVPKSSWRVPEPVATKPAEPVDTSGIDFVAARDNGLALMRWTAKGAVVHKQVAAPNLRDALWLGNQVIAFMGADEVSAYELKDSVWQPINEPNDPAWSLVDEDMELRARGNATAPPEFIASALGELWLSGCQNGRWIDGGGGESEEVFCDRWIYARLVPGPLAITDRPPYTLQGAGKVTPPASPKVTLAPASGTRTRNNAQQIVNCSMAGAASAQLPQARAGMAPETVDDLMWITSTPPMFALTTHSLDPAFRYQAPARLSFYEGCQRSVRFENATLVTGQNGKFAILTPRTTVLFDQGRQVGELFAATSVFNFRWLP